MSTPTTIDDLLNDPILFDRVESAIRRSVRDVRRKDQSLNEARTSAALDAIAVYVAELALVDREPRSRFGSRS